MISIQTWTIFTKRNKHEELKSPFVRYLFLPYLFMFQSMAISLFITTLFKEFNGRYRPNFFALCNYKGYADALKTNNFTYYDANTIQGRPGDIKYCLADQSVIREAQRSFPSGHSSMIFSGLMPLACFFLVAFERTAEKENEPEQIRFHWRKFRAKSFQVFMAMFICCFAFVVACTRTRDYYHNFDDVLAGCLIGIGSTLLSLYVNFEKVAKPHPIYHDTIDLQIEN